MNQMKARDPEKHEIVGNVDLAEKQRIEPRRDIVVNIALTFHGTDMTVETAQEYAEKIVRDMRSALFFPNNAPDSITTGKIQEFIHERGESCGNNEDHA
jgi:3-deoxy-D-arabino-heptulosonate 7-phosphate (DAHP) synthase